MYRDACARETEELLLAAAGVVAVRDGLATTVLVRLPFGVVCIEEVYCDTRARETDCEFTADAVGAAAGREGGAAVGVVRALAAGADGAGDLLGGDEGADVTDAGLLALGFVCMDEVYCDTCARETDCELLLDTVDAAAGREGADAAGAVRVLAAGADGAGDLLGVTAGADATDVGLLPLGEVCIDEVYCDTCARETDCEFTADAVGSAAGREGGAAAGAVRVLAAGADGAGDLLGAGEDAGLDGDACAVLPDEALDEPLELELPEDDLLPELLPRAIILPFRYAKSKTTVEI